MVKCPKCLHERGDLGTRADGKPYKTCQHCRDTDAQWRANRSEEQKQRDREAFARSKQKRRADPANRERDRESKRRGYYRNRDEILAATREWNYANRERKRQLGEKYNEANVEKLRAQKAVRKAIARGTLIRPEECEHCGARPPRARDGRSQIHAHHEDYSRRFDVEWLCKDCHGARHRGVDPQTGEKVAA